MAIDTNNKKFALITYQQPFNTPIPSSDDGLGQSDKQDLIWQYPGILWSFIHVFLRTAVVTIESKLNADIAIKSKLNADTTIESKLNAEVV